MKSNPSGVTLPPIKSTIFDTTHENPFEVPPDEEILNVKEMKTRKKLEKQAANSLPIWEKGLKFNRAGALRKIDEVDGDSKAYDDKITVAEAAHAALVTDRVRTKENIQKTIGKKREMFLLQMMIDIKKEEIKKLEQFALLREYGLKSSEDMLMEDMNRFNDYWDECKRESHDAMKEAKRLNKEKLDLTHEINGLTEEVQQLLNQIQKYEDSLAECRNYKDFLDKLISHGTVGKDSDPDMLTEIFHGLIEENLLLIQMIQELEQNLEQAKHEFEKLESETNEKMEKLVVEKQHYDKLIEDKERRCAQLEIKLKKEKDDERSGSPILVQLEETLRETLELTTDEGQQGCFYLLGRMEQELDIYLRAFDDLSKIDSVLTKQKVEELAKERRDLGRKKTLEEETKSNLEKVRRYNERTKNPKTRKIGRMPMPKSKPPEKKVKKIIPKTPPEERDRREFLEDED